MGNYYLVISFFHCVFPLVCLPHWRNHLTCKNLWWKFPRLALWNCDLACSSVVKWRPVAVVPYAVFVSGETSSTHGTDDHVDVESTATVVHSNPDSDVHSTTELEAAKLCQDCPTSSDSDTQQSTIGQSPCCLVKSHSVIMIYRSFSSLKCEVLCRCGALHVLCMHLKTWKSEGIEQMFIEIQGKQHKLGKWVFYLQLPIMH